MEFFDIFLYFLFPTLLLQLLFFMVGRGFESRNLPPGPTPFPIIGNLLNLGNMPHESLTRLARTYGPIMSLKFGQLTTIVISSPEMAQEILQKQDIYFSNRFVPRSICANDAHKVSIIFQPTNDLWRQLRKISYTHIFSGRVLDSTHHVRHKKVEELLEYTRKCCHEGVAVNIGRAAFQTSLNVLSNTFFSVDLANFGRDEAQDFKDLVWNVMEEVGKPNLIDYFPMLRVIDPQGIQRRMSLYFSKFSDLFGEIIDKKMVMKTFSSDISKSDVIDQLLRISQNKTEEIDKKQMMGLCQDLFIAGTDTTSSTLEWAMTELLRHPSSMINLKNELKQVVGIGKQVEESNIDELPYLRAVIKETLRMHPPAPLLVPRQVYSDVHLSGYTIPKGAQVLVNVWAIGRDPNHWQSPMEFKPERFIDSKIDVHGQDFELLPFGSGRRICPGLSLAMRILLTELGSLINSFDWKIEGNIKPEDLDIKEKFGITLQKANPLLAIPIPI